jgi:hypothetical protein
MGTYVKETIGRDGEQVEILIEVEERPPGGARRYTPYGPMRGDLDEVATGTFEKGMELIRTCAQQVADSVQKVSDVARPSEVEVQLGIKLDAAVGALIAKTGAEAQLQVRLKWVRKEL